VLEHIQLVEFTTHNDERSAVVTGKVEWPGQCVEAVNQAFGAPVGLEVHRENPTSGAMVSSPLPQYLKLAYSTTLVPLQSGRENREEIW
jgi:hypothetical protein